jgi:hypothetical protein
LRVKWRKKNGKTYLRVKWREEKWEDLLEGKLEGRRMRRSI